VTSSVNNEYYSDISLSMLAIKHGRRRRLQQATLLAVT